MKTIGLIGGTSWESTQDYYRLINTYTHQQLGQHHSARIILYSVNFQEIYNFMNAGKFDELETYIVDVAQKIEQSGADLLLLCANTMHLMAAKVQLNINIPLLHIVDATSAAIKSKDLKTVGLLGTKLTMEQEFIKSRFTETGIDIVVPEVEDRDFIQAVIFDELFLGIINESAKARLLEIIAKLQQSGAEGIILGCTELPMLLKDGDCKIPLFDTVAIHSKAAVDMALGVE